MTDPQAQPPQDPTRGQPQQPSGDVPPPQPAAGQAPPPPQQPPYQGQQQPPYQGQQPPYQGQQPPYQGQQPPYQGQQPPYQGQQYAGQQPGGYPLTPEQDKQWAMWGHLGGVLGFVPPLIIWLVFKDRGPFTNQEAKEALNFQITVAIFSIGLGILMTILTVITFGIAGLFFFLVYVPWILGVIFAIIAGVKVNNGEPYRYFFAIRMIK
ncbi:hypothetical protein GCM10027416_15650 [Okibacterium endophyticum]